MNAASIWSAVQDAQLWQERMPLLLTCSFLLFLYHVISYQPTMFLKRHGRKHALTGLVYLIWISWGFFSLLAPKLQLMMIPPVVYDFILGVLGIVLTLYAAQEFKHKNVKNVASGTLDEHATVTHNEMIEHSFYQGVNLAQILFLHVFAFFPRLHANTRFLLLVAVTAPWLWRGLFPVNSFSDNYNKEDEKSTVLIRVLYRIKKYQYVFYKHFILHGLNISVAVLDLNIVNQRYFRLFWLLLNTSYVMEFFLQTLVKKQYLSQAYMLVLQKVLMTAASLSAISVLRVVNIYVAFASLYLNFTRRKKDLWNTVLIAVVFFLYASMSSVFDEDEDHDHDHGN